MAIEPMQVALYTIRHKITYPVPEPVSVLCVCMYIPYLTIIVSLQNDFVAAIGTAVHQKLFKQFCIESAKCAIFADLSNKGICESNNMFLPYMLSEGNVNCIVLKALKC